MLPPPPRATKKEASAEGQQAMTDDDMTSWLLHGPMAGTSDDNPGGWQYGSHLMEGETPSLLEDAPPLDALPVPPLPLAEPQRDLKRERAASSPA